MDRILSEFRVMTHVAKSIFGMLADGADIKSARETMFKKGDSKYKTFDGDEVEGSYYQFIRYLHIKEGL